MSLPLMAKPGFKPMQAAPGVTNSHSFQQLSGSNISFLHDVTNNSSKLLLNGGWQPIFFSVSFKVLRIDQMKVWLHRVFFDSLPQVGDKVSVRSRKSYSRCFSSNRKKLSAASLALHEKWDHDFFLSTESELNAARGESQKKTEWPFAFSQFWLTGLNLNLIRFWIISLTLTYLPNLK